MNVIPFARAANMVTERYVIFCIFAIAPTPPIYPYAFSPRPCTLPSPYEGGPSRTSRPKTLTWTPCAYPSLPSLHWIRIVSCMLTSVTFPWGAFQIQCTWPEAVLPRRPKGAVRGLGNEDDEEVGLVDEDGRRQSIPGSAVSAHFPPPSSTTSSHFPGISNNSPFEPAPRRDAFESDGFPAGSQFS
jgi:hypothetical protein